MSEITMISLDNEHKENFVSLLEDALCTKFQTTIEFLPDNYGNKYSWSLLNLINNNELDTYQLLFVDDFFWAGSGGIVRNIDDKKIYQAGFRGFYQARTENIGLGSKFYIHNYNTYYQIARAKKHRCDSVILSFNEHNYKLFEITHRIILSKSTIREKFIPSENTIIFNGIPQWLLSAQLSYD